ncbi:MAG: MotA/TolQ/ExbB proton channel family protein [Desulfohalobiaceae bacterium]
MEIIPQTGFWSMLAGATIVVRMVLLLLGLMSLASWSVIFYKLFTLLRARSRSRNEFQAFQSAGSLASGMQILKRRSGSVLYAIGVQAVGELRRLESAPLSQSSKAGIAADNLRRVLRQGVSSELGRLSHSLSFLATCANAAPFIGLFGTVWGIMHSFHSIGLQKSAALATVAPGLSEALVATAIGLAVAIPATIAYNSFMGMLSTLETELVNFAGAFLNKAQRELSVLSAAEQSQEG